MLDIFIKYHEEIRNLGLVLFGGAGIILLLFRTVSYGKQVTISESNNLNEQFIKAIELLGATEDGKPCPELRIGAIYSLHELASNNERYVKPVINILCEYVRFTTRNIDIVKIEENTLDIHAAINVIGDKHFFTSFSRLSRRPKNLSGANLVGIEFNNLDLIAVDFSSSSIRRCKFKKTNFSRSLFTNSVWLDVKAYDSKFYGIRVESAKLDLVSFDNCDIRNVNFEEAMEEIDIQPENSEQSVLGKFFTGLLAPSNIGAKYFD